MKTLVKTGFMPYYSDLTKRARKNRKSQTEAEATLWNKLLRTRKLNGHKFTRQKPIHKYILDFYCSKLSLGIEVDGNSHKDKQDYDKMRTHLLNGFGINIIRFSNEDVINCIDEVRERLMDYIKRMKIQ